MDTEWFWIPGELNPADMGTRPTMTPESMGEESAYQKGFPWMYQPVENWPVKKDFTPPPVEECRKDVTQATCAVARVVRERQAYPSRASSRAKLVRIFGYVMMAVAAFKRQPGRIALIRTGAPGGKSKPGPPPEMLSRGRPGLPSGGCSKKHEPGRDGQSGGQRNHSGA